MNLIDKNNSDNNNYLIPRHVTGINDCLEANGLSGISFAYRNAVSIQMLKITAKNQGCHQTWLTHRGEKKANAKMCHVLLLLIFYSLVI